jgi:branched-subunit amino acid transport protein
MEWSDAFIAVGLGVITLVTRCFFFISQRELPFPAWAQRGLQYAPIAALAGFYFYKRGQGQAVLGTIIVGMAVYLPLHIGLGW